MPESALITCRYFSCLWSEGDYIHQNKFHQINETLLYCCVLWPQNHVPGPWFCAYITLTLASTYLHCFSLDHNSGKAAGAGSLPSRTSGYVGHECPRMSKDIRLVLRVWSCFQNIRALPLTLVQGRLHSLQKECMTAVLNEAASSRPLAHQLQEVTHFLCYHRSLCMAFRQHLFVCFVDA